MADGFDRYFPQQPDPFAPDTQRFQDAEATETPPVHDWSSSARQQQPRPASRSPVADLRSNNPFLRSVSPRLPYQIPGFPAPSYPWPPVSAPPQNASLQRQHSLGDYFAVDEIPRTGYTDQELADIARLLKESDREHESRVPRIYTVLRLIGQVPVIKEFLDLGMNDLWLPMHISQLPIAMSAFHRQKFVESQNMVLTKAIDLEKDIQKKHIHFQPGESFPLEVLDNLGKGGYASVDRVYSPLSGVVYARKTFRRTKSKPSEVQSFLNELQILKRINHAHCVELIASYTDSKYFGLIVSPVADYNLSQFYSRVLGSEENQKILRTFFGCLAHALQFLHHSKIRHRDIKPENILVLGSWVYLADFGISLDWENLSRSTTTEDSGKSWIYCAPEVAHYKSRNSSSDIWSLGCVFLEMFTVLKGFTIQDLRELFRKHSDRWRFYENFDTAMDWIEKLAGYGAASDNEIAHWIREMVIMEPSSRTTAESLATSTVLVGRNSRGQESATVFCGECCSHDHAFESSSEAVSDDDIWVRASGADLTTPATSPPVTDNSRRPEGSALGQSVEHHVSPSAEGTEDQITDLASRVLESGLSDSQLDKDIMSGDVRDYGAPQENTDHTSQSRNPESLRSDGLQETAEGSFRTQSVGEEGPSGTAQEKTSDLVASTGDQASTPPRAKSPRPGSESNKPNTSLERRIEIRRNLIEEATSNFEPWPTSNFRGRLPALDASSWKSPDDFLASVQSDTSFMEYLGSTNSSLFSNFRSAGQDDLLPMIYWLLLQGLDVNDPKFKFTSKKDKKLHGMVPLHWVLSLKWMSLQSRKNIAKFLIGYGANLDAATAGGALVEACHSGDIEIVQSILDLGSHLDDAKFAKDTALCTAARWGHLDIVDAMAKSGAHVNSHNSEGYTAIHWAASNGHVDVVDLLIERGADVRRTTSFDLTPLHLAARNGHSATVDALVKRGANVHAEGVDVAEKMNRSTALHLAAKNGDVDVVRILLERGADPDGKASLVETPLYLAARQGHHLVAELLINRGADIRSWNGYKVGTPCFVAAHNGQLKVLEVFQKNGMDVDEDSLCHARDWRLLHSATEQGHTEVVKFLLSKGANPARRTFSSSLNSLSFSASISGGVTPLSLAKKKGHTEIVSILEKAIKEWKRKGGER